MISISRKYRLIKSVKYDASAGVLNCVTIDDLFDILNTCHTAIGHDGRDKMACDLEKSSTIL